MNPTNPNKPSLKTQQLPAASGDLPPTQQLNTTAPTSRFSLTHLILGALALIIVLLCGIVFMLLQNRQPAQPARLQDLEHVPYREDLSIQINSTRTTNQLIAGGGHIQAPPLTSSEYLICKVTLHSSSEKTISLIDEIFELTDENGKTHNADVALRFHTNITLIPESIDPGDTVSGEIAFEVPIGTKAVSIRSFS